MKLVRGSVLLASLALVGCTSPKSPRAQQEGAYSGQVISSGPAATGAPPVYNAGAYNATADQALANQVRQTLQDRPNLAALAPNIGVAAENGTVTLSGTVPGEPERRQIDDAVSRTSGVMRVQDRMQVLAPPTGRDIGRVYGTSPEPVVSTGTAATTGDIFNLHVQGLNETDRTLAQRILEGLRTDTALASLLPTVNINVTGGQVVLQGRVESEQQRQTIGSVVQRAAGPGNVVNQLQVAGGAPVINSNP